MQQQETISAEETRAVVAAWMARSHLTPEASVAARASVADLAEGLGVGEEEVAALLAEVRAERAEAERQERELLRQRAETARARAALAEAEARLAEAQARKADAEAVLSSAVSQRPSSLSWEERRFQAIAAAAALFMLACFLWIMWKQAEAGAQRAYPASPRSHFFRRNPGNYP